VTVVVDSDYVVKTLADLVRINSSNPSLTPGNPGEGEIAAYIADALRGIGLEVTVNEVEAGRPNVVGRLKGAGGGRSLMVNGHTDTVGVEGMADPFSGEIRDGKLYGRGAQDMKGSLAAMLGALKSLVDGDVSLAGDVLAAAVIDEEYVSLGTVDLIKHYTADAAIVMEPSDMAISRAHRGFTVFEVETIGRMAHGSRYEEGIDANIRMGRLLAQLDGLEKALRASTPHPLMGLPSLNVPLVKGGSELYIYAERCVADVERRTISGETEAEITREMQDILDRLSAEDPAFKATMKTLIHRGPFEVPAEAEIVQTLERAVTARLGKKPEHIGQTFWTDAGLLADAGIETVLIGPRGAGLHSAEEWVEVQSVVDLAHILAETAVAYCA